MCLNLRQLTVRSLSDEDYFLQILQGHKPLKLLAAPFQHLKQLTFFPQSSWLPDDVISLVLQLPSIKYVSVELGGELFSYRQSESSYSCEEHVSLGREAHDITPAEILPFLQRPAMNSLTPARLDCRIYRDYDYQYRGEPNPHAIALTGVQSNIKQLDVAHSRIENKYLELVLQTMPALQSLYYMHDQGEEYRVHGEAGPPTREFMDQMPRRQPFFHAWLRLSLLRNTVNHPQPLKDTSEVITMDVFRDMPSLETLEVHGPWLFHNKKHTEQHPLVDRLPPTLKCLSIQHWHAKGYEEHSHPLTKSLSQSVYTDALRILFDGFPDNVQDRLPSLEQVRMPGHFEGAMESFLQESERSLATRGVALAFGELSEESTWRMEPRGLGVKIDVN